MKSNLGLVPQRELDLVLFIRIHSNNLEVKCQGKKWAVRGKCSGAGPVGETWGPLRCQGWVDSHHDIRKYWKESLKGVLAKSANGFPALCRTIQKLRVEPSIQPINKSVLQGHLWKMKGLFVLISDQGLKRPHPMRPQRENPCAYRNTTPESLQCPPTATFTSTWPQLVWGWKRVSVKHSKDERCF